MNWRAIQRKNFIRLPALLDFLQIEEKFRVQISPNSKFPLNVPLRLAEKMEKNCVSDPLFRQFVPLVEEEKQTSGFSMDPVGDCLVRRGQRLLHKYAGRALLLTTSACAMHCRYCFRQHFAYPSRKGFEEELSLIRKDPTLFEIILSGGDPLSLKNETLETLFEELSKVSHLKILRIHTRFPIGIPERIDEELLRLFSRTRLQIVFVIHANHPRELDEEVFSRLKAISKLGIPLLNQSVLLKGVNDSVETLKALNLQLIENGILPYYIHQLDRVQGSSHFEVPQAEGEKLLSDLQKELPGYAVPKYVQEISGEKAKTLIL